MSLKYNILAATPLASMIREVVSNLLLYIAGLNKANQFSQEMTSQKIKKVKVMA